LAKQNCIILESPNESIFRLVSESHLVVGYPFTSPLYIADYMRIPSIYFDPTELIVDHNFGGTNTLINFASGQLDLLSKSIKLLGIYNTKNNILS
jgi:polysaccharide biosynthesis PFTS motif protein